jgi:Uma2 family endonuclease
MSSGQRTEKKTWTYNDYLGLDDDIRYEIIEGDLLMAPAPDMEHHGISRDVGFDLWQYVKGKELGQVFYAPIDVILDEENVVQPDLVFISRGNLGILQKQGIIGSPDMVVEILSPSSFYRDRYEKKALYERFKVEEYWIVDPANSTVEVFVLEETGYQLFSFASESGTVRSRVIEGYAVDVAEILKGSRV